MERWKTCQGMFLCLALTCLAVPATSGRTVRPPLHHQPQKWASTKLLSAAQQPTSSGIRLLESGQEVLPLQDYGPQTMLEVPSKQLLSVLVPVFPQHEDQLRNLWVQLRTLVRFLDTETIAHYIVATPSDSFQLMAARMQETLEFQPEILPKLPRKKIKIMKDEQCAPDLVSPKYANVPEAVRLQIMKLACARVVETPFYLLLEPHDFFARPLGVWDVVNQSACSKEAGVCDAPGILQFRSSNEIDVLESRPERYLASADVLGIRAEPPMVGKTRSLAAGPAVLATDISRGLATHLEALAGAPMAVHLLQRAAVQGPQGVPWTAHHLYWLFAKKYALWEKYHVAGILNKRPPAPWTPAEFERWKPCERELSSASPGLLASVRAAANATAEQVWDKLQECWGPRDRQRLLRRRQLLGLV